MYKEFDDDLASRDVQSFNNAKMSKKGKAKPKAQVLSKVDTDRTSSIVSSKSGYEDILSFQAPEGYFSGLPKTLSSKLIDSLPDELEGMLKEAEDAKNVWLTILALLLLEKDYCDSKAEWVMIAKKAKAYLKKRLVKDADISIFKSYVN